MRLSGNDCTALLASHAGALLRYSTVGAVRDALTRILDAGVLEAMDRNIESLGLRSREAPSAVAAIDRAATLVRPIVPPAPAREPELGAELALARTRVRALLAGEHGALAAMVERELEAIDRHLGRALIAHVEAST